MTTVAPGWPSVWDQERCYKQSYDHGLPTQHVHIVDRTVDLTPPGVSSLLLPMRVLRKYKFLKTARLVPTMVDDLRNYDHLLTQQSAPQLPERDGLTKTTAGVLVDSPYRALMLPTERGSFQS